MGRELVLLDGPGRTLRGLNPTGARVWELIDGARSVQEIARVLSQELAVPEARALEDVLAFLEALRQRELVTL